jgi:hypothetical protein
MSFNVTSYADLKKVGTGVDGWNLDSDYIQTANIDASASATENPDGSGGYYGFDPIGDYINKFTGTYDGGGYTISNLYIHRTAINQVGLFRYPDSSAEISNLGIIDCDITGYRYVGGFCGYNLGTITSCYSTGSVRAEAETSYVGGFCGYNLGTITSCYSTGSASGTNYVSGFCGYNLGTITSCYSTGSASGTSYVSGFCGRVYSSGTITNCYSTGSVSGTSYVGGFCTANDGTITSCYWDTETSGQATSNGGTGLTTAQMTYEYSGGAYSGWDFTNIWRDDSTHEENDGYPRLLAFIDNYVNTKPASGVINDSARLNGEVVL